MDKKINETIIQLIKEKKPENVEQLVKLLKEEFNIPEHRMIEHVLQLQSEGKVVLKKPSKSTPQSLVTYLKTEARWYWITIVLTVSTTLVAFTIPENAFPLVYIRYLLGAISVLWLPGYSLVKALFPTGAANEDSSGDLDVIERIALTIGLSLALVPIVGLILNYTPWGIRLTPIVLSLFALTAIFATVAIIREHQTKIKIST